MRQYLNIIVVGTIIANVLLFWNTDAVFGWLVALVGWLPHAFKDGGKDGDKKAEARTD